MEPVLAGIDTAFRQAPSLPPVLALVSRVLTASVARFAPSPIRKMEVVDPAVKKRTKVRRITAIAAAPNEQRFAVIHVVLQALQVPARLATPVP